jgi:valyl-tRNA synthetase
MAAIAVLGRPGQPMKLSPARVEGYRNFATKLWNATRFSQRNGVAVPPDFDPAGVKLAVNRWILGELARCAAAVDTAITEFRFNDAANALYSFVWGTLCDWYLELTKPILQGEDESARAETRAVTGIALRETVKLLHPIMPFITEEIWDKLGHRASAGALISQAWPENLPAPDTAADDEMGWLVKLIADIRSARAEVNVPPAAKLKLMVRDANPVTRARLATHRSAIERLARIESIEADGVLPPGSLQLVIGEATYALPVGEVIDLAAERARLDREIRKLEGEVSKIEAKLGNAQFLARAPEEVVEEQRERRSEALSTAARLRQASARLAG